ncbi:MAG: hypothetical protein VXU42_01445 [Verrucomicrobiota bacterium]|nr:hypothetical protein [Verrucomicrobiota bacterium]
MAQEETKKNPPATDAPTTPTAPPASGGAATDHGETKPNVTTSSGVKAGQQHDHAAGLGNVATNVLVESGRGVEGNMGKTMGAEGTQGLGGAMGTQQPSDGDQTRTNTGGWAPITEWLVASNTALCGDVKTYEGMKMFAKTIETIEKLPIPKKEDIKQAVSLITDRDPLRPYATLKDMAKVKEILFSRLARSTRVWGVDDIINSPFEGACHKLGIRIPHGLVTYTSRPSPSDETDDEAIMRALGITPTPSKKDGVSELGPSAIHAFDMGDNPMTPDEAVDYQALVRHEAWKSLQEMCDEACVPLKYFKDPTKGGWADWPTVDNLAKIWDATQVKVVEIMVPFMEQLKDVSKRQLDIDLHKKLHDMAQHNTFSEHEHQRAPLGRFDIIVGIKGSSGVDSWQSLKSTLRATSVGAIVQVKRDFWSIEDIPADATPATDLAYVRQKVEEMNRVMGTQQQTFCIDSIIMLVALAQRKSKETTAAWASANWIDRVNEMEELVIDPSTGALQRDDVLKANVPAVQKIFMDLAAERRLEPGPQYEAQLAAIEKRKLRHEKRVVAGGRAEETDGDGDNKSDGGSQSKGSQKGKKRVKNPLKTISTNRKKKVEQKLVETREDGLYNLGIRNIVDELEDNGSKGPLGKLADYMEVASFSPGRKSVRWKSQTEKLKSLDLDDYQHAVALLINDELSKSVADQRKELLNSFLEQNKKKKSKKKKKNKTGGGAKAGSGDADGDDPQQPQASSTDGGASSKGGSSEQFEMRRQSNGDIFFVSKSTNSIVHVPAHDDGSSVYLDAPLTPEEQQAQELADLKQQVANLSARVGGSN